MTDPVDLPPLTGGCLCGRVRYTARGAPTFELNCHCRVCQKITGSGYTPVAAFAEAAPAEPAPVEPASQTPGAADEAPVKPTRKGWWNRAIGG